MKLSSEVRDGVIESFKKAWYSKTVERFETTMASFMAHLKTLSTSVATALTTYFDGQMKSKSRWAHCYRSNVLTLMANTTQRAEGVNGQIGRVCSGSTTFTTLVVAVENITVDIEDTTANTDYTRSNRILLDSCGTDLNNRDGVKEIESQCKDHLSKYAANMVFNELRRAHLYQVSTSDCHKRFKVSNLQ